jgi:hypothetical protein
MLPLTFDVPEPFSRERFWADLVNRNGFRTIAEIGVWKGELAAALLASCPDITTYWMIDPWRRLPAWNKPLNVTDDEFGRVYEQALAATAGHAGVRQVLRGTTGEVIDRVPDGSLDFVYVDGDHTLRGITLDLLLAWPKVRDGGAIGGDDCVPYAWQHAARFEPTFVSPWVAYFAEAMRAPLTILPAGQFLIHKSADGFRIDDRSGSPRTWSVAAHLGISPTRSAPERPTFGRRMSLAARRGIIRGLRRMSPAFREHDSTRRYGPFPPEVQEAGLLFIHVPKAAGTSIHMALYGRSLGHDSLATWQENYPRSMAGIRTAAIVRDPVDRFLSAFHYLKRGGMNDADVRFKAEFMEPYATAGDLAEAIANTHVRRWLLNEGYHFRRQADFLRDVDGVVRIDHLFAFERLDEAASRVSELLGRPVLFPRLNTTPRPVASLTDRQRELVQELYAEDVALHARALGGPARS